jgi:hypothetical protein
MFEFPVKDLTSGDEFTIDDGLTWHVVRNVAVRPNVPNTDDETFELDPNELVIVK